MILRQPLIACGRRASDRRPRFPSSRRKPTARRRPSDRAGPSELRRRRTHRGRSPREPPPSRRPPTSPRRKSAPLDAEFPRQGLREARELGRFAGPAVLMAPVEPVPATGRIRAPRLVWIGDDETELVGQGVHLRSKREIFRILRAPMQHQHQREVPLARDLPEHRAGSSANRRGRDRRARESFAEIMRGPRVGRLGRVAGSGSWRGGRARRAGLRPVDAASGAQGRNPAEAAAEASGSLPAAPASSPDSAWRRRAVASAKFDFRTRFSASPMASRKRGFIILSRRHFHQRRRSASAALTSAGACSAPSTVINSIVALREIGRDVVGDDRQAQHANSEPLPRRLNGFEVPAGEGPQAQFERQPRGRLSRRIRVPSSADCGSRCE